MVLFNYALKELTAKIVYYGPGLSGKTTNLQYIYEELPIKNKGRMLTLATETDRTLYFDFLPVDAGVVRGIKTRVQLYTVPGQVFYNATRRMVLKGADGVVFVADSQRSMMEANHESFENLRDNLKAHDLDVDEMPLVLQFNKRDLESVSTIEEMVEQLNPGNAPFYEAVAKDGIGVEDTLQAISGLVLKSVIDRYGGDRMSPMGRVPGDPSRTDPARTDPARTDPEALVTASVHSGKSEAVSESAASRGGGGGFRSGGGGGGAGAGSGSGGTGGGGRGSDLEDDVSSQDESLENFNIEGILDEALKLDSDDREKSTPSAPPVAERRGAAPTSEDGISFSGLLDEALSESDADSFLDEALGPEAKKSRGASDDDDPMREIEIELMGDQTSNDPQVGVSSNLSELIKTRVSIPTDKVTTAPGIENVPGRTERVEVPVTLHIDGDVEEQDIELTLKIRIKRK